MRRITLERALNIGSLAVIIGIGGALGTIFGLGEAPMARSAESTVEVAKPDAKPESKAEEKAPETAAAASAGKPAGAAPSAKEEADEVEEHAAKSSDVCVTGAALDDLAVQRERLVQKEKDLAQRETELRTLESSVKKEFSRLEQMRADMAAMDNLKAKENEEKVAKVIDTLQSMSPKAASQMFATLDDALAVTAMQRMDTPKIAKILNLLEPGRSAHLTELMAGVTRARSMHASAQNGAAGSSGHQVPAYSKKGGENNDGQNQQQKQQSIGNDGSGGSIAKAEQASSSRRPAGQ